MATTAAVPQQTETHRVEFQTIRLPAPGCTPYSAHGTQSADSSSKKQGCLATNACVAAAEQVCPHTRTYPGPQSTLLHAVPIRQRAFAVIGSSMLVAKQDQVQAHALAGLGTMLWC